MTLTAGNLARAIEGLSKHRDLATKKKHTVPTMHIFRVDWIFKNGEYVTGGHYKDILGREIITSSTAKAAREAVKLVYPYAVVRKPVRLVALKGKDNDRR